MINTQPTNRIITMTAYDPTTNVSSLKISIEAEFTYKRVTVYQLGNTHCLTFDFGESRGVDLQFILVRDVPVVHLIVYQKERNLFAFRPNPDISIFV